MDRHFREHVAARLERYRPTRHRFFALLADAPTARLTGPVLDDLYHRYQAAMHATRAMVYFLPHLDTVDLRLRKFRIIADDDGLSDGDSHHAQLRRAWAFMLGREPSFRDDECGGLADVAAGLDPATAAFVTLVHREYPRTLGPWLAVEGLAHDWIGGLFRGLARHFPGVERTDYFIENYLNEVEVRHAQDALETVELVVSRRAGLAAETLAGIDAMGRALDGLWDGMAALLATPPGRR